MKQPVVLRIYKGDKLESVRQFQQSQIVIGRNADVQLELQDEAVALLHALIEDRGDDYFVSDLGSSTGTFKNGARVLEEKLVSGDQLTVGPFQLQFFIGVPKPAAPPKVIPTPAPEPVAPPAALTFTAAASEPPPAEPLLESIPLPAAPPTLKEEPSAASAAHTAAQVYYPAAETKTKVVVPEAPKVHKAPLAFASRGTYAPASPFKDLKEIIRPHKGPVIEVMVAWKDRVLSSNHFRDKGSVFLSSSENADVVVPILSSRSRYELLKIGAQTIVCLTPEMTGEVIRDGETVAFSELARQNKLRNAGTHFELELKQGEMIRVGLQDDLISIYIRNIADTPKALVAPLMDMSSSEVTGIILALLVAGVCWFYMNIFTPTPLLDDEAKIEEPLRKAVVTFNPPKPKQIAEAVDLPKDKVAKAVEKPRATPTPSVEKKGDPGKAGEVAPKPDSQDKQKKLTSARPGGAIKTAPKEGASAKSEKPDPSKMGLLGVFSSKGTQSKLDKAYSGSGELQGMADSATGYAGNADSREGDNLGTKMKDTGAGGKGSATIGISGVGTNGRGTGNTGYGTGGIGQKGSVQINVGGQDGEFATGMDKEAIRRVIREHLREIQNCYERELQRSPDLYGKLVLEWDIEEAGHVSRCVVKSNALGNDTVANCIASRLKTWKFPDPPKDMVGRVSYPFVFSSR